MKRLYVIIGLITLSYNNINCQEPTISMTTTQDTGSYFTLGLYAYENKTLIRVDFGDGILVAEEIDSTYTSITGRVKGSKEIKISGDSIKFLDCNSSQLLGLNVTNATLLKGLRCNSNNLNSLDLSHNLYLSILCCYNNPLDSLDLSKNTKLTDLYCMSNNLSFLDVSNNPKLTYIQCDNNMLTSLDVSKNM